MVANVRALWVLTLRGAMMQRILGSHTPPCHRRMVITTISALFCCTAAHPYQVQLVSRIHCAQVSSAYKTPQHRRPQASLNMKISTSKSLRQYIKKNHAIRVTPAGDPPMMLKSGAEALQCSPTLIRSWGIQHGSQMCPYVSVTQKE